MSGSRYDELHDRFFSILSSKEGTRYERLAAIVFKTLHEQNVVIHDFKLRGDSSVKHQIDVVIETGGKQKHVLIECKDFDKSGRLVGLSILRDFRSVVEDTKADEAFVLTCKGYTKPALKYAKAKGIKLAIFRVFEEKDWEGRIRQVNVDLHIQTPPHVESVNVGFASAEREAFLNEVATGGMPSLMFTKESPIYVVNGKEQVQVVEYLELEASKFPAPLSPTSHEINLDPAIWQIQIGSCTPHAFTQFKVIFRAFPVQTRRLEIGQNRIAELILKGFGKNDIVIFADQLRRAKIDSEGRVTFEAG